MSCTPTKHVLRAADFVTKVCRKTEPAWMVKATEICKTLGALQPCFPLYAAFKNLTNPADIKKPHVFMNDEAKTKLAEFYLCSAYQLRRADVEQAGSDNGKLLKLIEDAAQNTVEPFLDQVRAFVADYNSELHQRLEETTVYKSIDPRLFWHHSFLLTSADKYAQFLGQYDEVYTSTQGDKQRSQDELDAVMIQDEVVVSRAQEVYDQWVEASCMPLKGQIKNALIDHGFIFGQKGYEPSVQRRPQEVDLQ